MDVLPPRPLLAVCLLLLGGLAWTVEGRSAPAVAVADLERWEGQSVLVEAWAAEVGEGADGSVRLTLSDGRHAVAARLPSLPAAAIAAGDRIAIEGRLLRGSSGALLLVAEGAADVRRLPAPGAADPGWDAVAAAPEDWSGSPLRLAGTVERARLRTAGHSVLLGDGPWPDAGAVEADGVLRYDDACLCYAFDARQVRPWTP